MIDNDIHPSMCSLVEQHLKECYSCRDKVIRAVRTIDARLAGATKSNKKAKASRANGKLGGRPRKDK